MMLLTAALQHIHPGPEGQAGERREGDATSALCTTHRAWLA